MKLINNCVTTDIYMADNFSDLGKNVESLGRKVLWICDSNTARMVRPLPEPNIVLPSCEDSKSFNSVEKIITKACEENFSKDDIFLALGGGVVLDTTAFAASIFKRGCALYFIPTTLLAMTDAAIGGKTGINFLNCKNCVGTYYPANKVIICPDCLKSLSEHTFISGIGEIIKVAFLAENEDLLKELVINKDKILKQDDSALRNIIELAIKIKCDYVNRDPYELLGIRKSLNLGHTFGHALESVTRMKISHGQAVAWGVCRSVNAAVELNLCEKDFADSVVRLYSDYNFNVNYKVNFGEWNEYVRYLEKDKKVKNNELKFVLLTEQGKTVERVLENKLIKKLVIEESEVGNVLL